MKNIRILLFLLLLPFSLGLSEAASLPPKPQLVTRQELQVGDIVFTSMNNNPLSKAIMDCTQSPYSHCGIVVLKDGQPAILEAFFHVKVTPLASFLARRKDHTYAVYRLKAQYQKDIPSFINAAYRYLGRPYDFHMDMDDKRIYCSELVYKAWRDATGGQMGKLCKLGDLNWRHHVMLIRLLENGRLPLDKVIITPKNLSESDYLQQIRPLS